MVGVEGGEVGGRGQEAVGAMLSTARVSMVTMSSSSMLLSQGGAWARIRAAAAMQMAALARMGMGGMVVYGWPGRPLRQAASSSSGERGGVARRWG